ncbi:hypothetical protein HG530_003201 [Fusarium avenaceum]|nr:hypothetical protein HG530_003201 [Fusarium avenaceum]
MNMLFTWNTNNLCIVFRQWHVRSTTSLFFSLVAVVLLAVGYEALRSLSRRYEEALDNRVRTAPRQSQGQADQRAHLIKAVLYGLQNFYAFMLIVNRFRLLFLNLVPQISQTICMRNDLRITQTVIMLKCRLLRVCDPCCIHQYTCRHTPDLEPAVWLLLGF